MRALLLAATMLAAPALAHAQSYPQWQEGYVPGVQHTTTRPIPTTNCVPAATNASPACGSWIDWLSVKQDADGDGSALQVTVASHARTLADKAADLLTPADFLGSGMTTSQLLLGAVDLGPPLVAAATAKQAVKLPCGAYSLNTAAVFTSAMMVAIEGSSPGCAVINVTFATGDIFLFNAVAHARVNNIQVVADVPNGAGGVAPRISGAVFHLLNTYDASLLGDTASGPHAADVFLVDGANTTHIDHYDCRPPVAQLIGKFGAGACVHLTGPAGSVGVADVHLSHGNSASFRYGIELTFASGVYADNIDNVISGNGIIFDPGAGQSIYGAQFTTVLGDTSYADNWYFGGTGYIADVQATNAWASNSQTANGYAFANAALDGFTCTGCNALSNYAAGDNEALGKNIDFTGAHIEMNSLAAPGSYDDIYIGSGVLSASVVGGMTGQGGTLSAQGSVNRTRYGINVQAGGTAAQNLTFIGVRGAGHTTAATNIPASGGLLTVTNLGNTGN